MTFPIIPTQVPGEALSFREADGKLILFIERQTEVYGLQVTGAILTAEAEAALLEVLEKRSQQR